MDQRLGRLADAGQSIWLDNIRRDMFRTGELRRLIDLGLRGMTSNPTIFEKAIGAGTDYDEQLSSLAGSERDPQRLFEALAIADIRSACDEFAGLYDATGGADGFVSLEVSPLLARDTSGTIAAAQRLWQAVDRPNVMIKIPGTPEGLPAITETIAAGVNVNVTLLFSTEQYEAAANAYLAGIERRVDRGEPVERVASVASVFVSRIDTAVDKLLDERIAKGEALTELRGKVGVAGLKLTYQRFKELFEHAERFARLRAAGAHVQRPLWASTSTKNPSYPDLMYVEPVVAPQTVNTLPPATLDALMDHGVISPDTAERDVAAAREEIERVERTGISLVQVTEQLQVDGVRLFADSYNAMLAAIAQKQQRLTSAVAAGG
ncbi:MAG: transaldolase [Candidatus Eremiobacteraeota bacterium]|nr:transaldolase [Candidatus Eremiobacteraeota bacterium]